MSRLYAFGSNGSGQLGIGTTKDTSSPQRCLFRDTDGPPRRLSKIAAGGNHTLILNESGDLYSSGMIDDDDGRGDLESLDHPEHIFRKHYTLNSKLLFCAALWEASVLVTDGENIYAKGKGPKGELGTGAVISPQWQRLLTFPPSGTHIVDVASGVAHTVIILSNGEAYGWGNGRKGQLGEPPQIVETPRKIQNLGFSVMRAVCGREFTYFVGEATEGRHVICGSGKWNVNSDAPSAVQNWIDLGASWGSIYVLKTDGKIISWGRNDHGQLAPPGLPNIKHIAVGSEHVLALTTAGAVLTWGWGEHGNCGLQTDKAGDVIDRWNEIHLEDEVDAQVVGVGAGCATSFIWVKTIYKEEFRED